MEAVAYKLQTMSLDASKIDNIIKTGARELAQMCTPPVDPRLIEKDVVTVLLKGLDVHANRLQDAKIDPLIGNVIMADEDEDEDACSNATILQVGKASETLAVSSKEESPDLLQVFQKYGLSSKFTKTAVRSLSAVQVRQLVRDVTAELPNFESTFVRSARSKSGVPTKEDLIDAIMAIRKV